MNISVVITNKTSAFRTQTSPNFEQIHVSKYKYHYYNKMLNIAEEEQVSHNIYH